MDGVLPPQKHLIKMFASRLICAALLLGGELIWAQTDGVVPPLPATSAPTSAPDPSAAPIQPSRVVVPLNNDRILKIIPNYQTVENSHQNIAPMTPKEKWHLAWKNMIDPFNVSSAALGAALSQAADATPKYGRGSEALAERFGASNWRLWLAVLFVDGSVLNRSSSGPAIFP
jgi:hypothetical protein